MNLRRSWKCSVETALIIKKHLHGGKVNKTVQVSARRVTWENREVAGLLEEGCQTLTHNASWWFEISLASSGLKGTLRGSSCSVLGGLIEFKDEDLSTGVKGTSSGGFGFFHGAGGQEMSDF